MSKYYDNISNEIKNYFKILEPDFPEWLNEYIDTKELLSDSLLVFLGFSLEFLFLLAESKTKSANPRYEIDNLTASFMLSDILTDENNKTAKINIKTENMIQPII